MIPGRAVAVGAAVIALLLSSGGCSSGGDSSPETAGASTPAKGSAQELLDTALKEHAQGDLAKAKRDYTNVLDNDPRSKFALYNLGVIAQTQGDNVQAVKHYQQALTVDPGYNPALYNLAILTDVAGNPQAAVDGARGDGAQPLGPARGAAGALTAPACVPGRGILVKTVIAGNSSPRPRSVIKRRVAHHPRLTEREAAALS